MSFKNQARDEEKQNQGKREQLSALNRKPLYMIK